MPVECIWFDEVPDGPWEPGWCFPLSHGMFLSRHYLEQVAKIRPAISVVLPSRSGHPTTFCIDRYPSSDPAGRWTLTVAWPFTAGTKPAITVHPSIDAVGDYHGWLVDGVLSDDLG